MRLPEKNDLRNTPLVPSRMRYKHYKIDFDKVKSLEDVVTILKGMDITVAEWHSKFDDMKHLLREESND